MVTMVDPPSAFLIVIDESLPGSFSMEIALLCFGGGSVPGLAYLERINVSSPEGDFSKTAFPDAEGCRRETHLEKP